MKLQLLGQGIFGIEKWQYLEFTISLQLNDISTIACLSMSKMKEIICIYARQIGSLSLVNEIFTKNHRRNLLK